MRHCKKAGARPPWIASLTRGIFDRFSFGSLLQRLGSFNRCWLSSLSPLSYPSYQRRPVPATRVSGRAWVTRVVQRQLLPQSTLLSVIALQVRCQGCFKPPPFPPPRPPPPPPPPPPLPLQSGCVDPSSVAPPLTCTNYERIWEGNTDACGATQTASTIHPIVRHRTAFATAGFPNLPRHRATLTLTLAAAAEPLAAAAE